MEEIKEEMKLGSVTNAAASCVIRIMHPWLGPYT